jgi:ribulose-phosphate 3-epimerase
MIEVIPAILVDNFEELGNRISRLVGVSNMVQIDVCDGSFVTSVSWPMNKRDQSSILPIIDEEEGLPFWDKIDFEFDLMIEKSYEQFDFFYKLGAKRIIFHIKENDILNFQDFLDGIDIYFRENIEIGLAIGAEVDLEKIKTLINRVDFIQCMGIKRIGFQGEPFDKNILEKIKELKKNYPDIKISIDGGVNEETASSLIEAGADRLVIGSALNKAFDLKSKIKEFEDLSID